MHMSKVIAVFSPKGGVGKTTISVNLALALTEKGARRVCLVDLDLAFGDVAITMQLFPTHSIEQAIGSEDSIDVEMLDGLLTRHQDSLMVLAAPPHPDTRERITPLLVSRIIRTLRETFDYVVIDTGPGLRRAGAHRARRDRRDRPGHHPRRTDAEERQGRRRDLRRAPHRP